MTRFMGVMAVVMAFASAQAFAQAVTVAKPAGQATSSFEKSAFSKNGNSFARERGLAKPSAAAMPNDIKAFYGQQAGGSGYAPSAAPRSPAIESSDR